jgi:high affinity Mn2+ porin
MKKLMALFILAPSLAFADQAEDKTAPAPEQWSFHAQATEILQGAPSFSAPYSGANSLSPNSQVKNTTTATLFLGARLWQGAQIYFDPELYEGKGLSNSFGVAGFPNGEANKAGAYDFGYGDARLFLRQEVALGDETEAVEAGPNRLAGREAVSRLTFTIGKFAASDIFDDNRYSHDPRSQFLNWALMDSAAWDYPANARGYAQGVALELNQKHWALRYGAFLEPKTPNGNDFVFHGANSFGQVAELEERYAIAQRAGATRFLLFWNRDRAGVYADAIDRAIDPETLITQDRAYGRNKYGMAISSDQELTDDLGAFLRASFNDGRTEEWTFTQVQESLSAGLSLQGKRWERPDDTAGLAGIVNGLFASERTFLARGGGGLIIGDGKLHYAPETIFEAYYSFKVTPWATLSPDYQFILNPGYNQDRGPVDVFAVRLHLEY